MKETILKCDVCGKPNAKTITVTGDSYTDEAGGRDTYQMSFEICGDCAIEDLNHLLDAVKNCKNLTQEAAINFVIGSDWEWQR